MRSLHQSKLAALAAIALALPSTMGSANGDVVLQDTFAYADAAEFAAAGWTTVAGTPTPSGDFSFDETSSGFIGATDRPATQSGLTLLKLSNAATSFALPATYNGDWTLDVSLLTNAYQRSQDVGVTDASGNGYSLRWDSALPTANGGKGALSIRKLTGWPAGSFANGAAIGSAASTQFPTGFELPADYAGSNPIVYLDPPFLGFTTLTLSRSAATGLLTLSQDGVPLVSATDTSFTNFSRIYVGGGSSVFIDNLTFDAIPEPASAGLASAAFFGARRPRRASRGRSILLRRRWSA